MGATLSYPDVDLSGKVALVTGGNTGIGYETAKALARLGAHTFIACRSKERAEQAIERMKQELNPAVPESGSHKTGVAAEAAPPDRKDSEKEEKEGDGKDGEVKATAEGTASEVEGEVKQNGESVSATEGQGEGAVATSEDEEVKSKEESSQTAEGKEVKVEYIPLDLASFQSTKECVRIFKERDLPLHILVNNAAVCWIPFSLTGDGYEMQLQVNHLGPMLLTLELLPLLVSTAESCGDVRICFVSSKANSAAQRFDMAKFVVTKEEEYSRLRTYPNTKLYNIMVGEALQRRLEGVAITVSSPEPGSVKTEIHRGWADLASASILTKMVSAVVGRTPAEGAATSINCVVNPDLCSKQHLYYSDCKPARPSSEALDESKQEALWKKSIEILRDHLCQDVLDKYGAIIEEPKPQEISAGSKPATSEATAPETAAPDAETADKPATSDSTGEATAPETATPCAETADKPATSDSTGEATAPETATPCAETADKPATSDSTGEATAPKTATASVEIAEEKQQETEEVTSDQKDGQKESLPEEPMEDRAEEQEVNPPGGEEEQAKEDSDVAGEKSAANEGSVGTGNEETS